MMQALLHLISAGVIMLAIALGIAAAARSRQDTSAERAAVALRIIAITAMACAFKYALTF